MTRSNFRLPLLVAILFGFGCLPSLFAQEGIAWEKDINTALVKARETDRLVLVHFHGPNCPSCRVMEAEVFTNRQVIADMHRFFVPVKVDSVLNPQLVKQFNITGIPADVVLRGDGKFVHRRQGGISAERFAVYLNYINDEAKPKNTAQSVRQAPPPVSLPEPRSPVAPSVPIPPPLTNVPLPSGNIWDTVVTPSPVIDPVGLQASPALVQAAPERSNPIRTDSGSPVAKGDSPQEVATFVEGSTGQTVEIPLALDGFCPVTLGIQERWQPGNPLYYAMFRGQIFRCVSEESLEAFSKDPAKYAPVAMGEDIVQMVNRQRKIVGQRKFGAWFQDRVYLFSSQESLDAFAAKPEYYAEIAIKYETALRTRFDAVQR